MSKTAEFPNTWLTIEEQGGLLEGLRAAYQTLNADERQRIKRLMAELAEKLHRSALRQTDTWV